MKVFDAVGMTGPEFEVVIERGKIKELARASGSSHPAYLTHASPVVPPTYLASVAYLWGYTFEYPENTPFANVELDRSVLLHGGEECEFFGPPPRAGTRLTAQPRIADVQTKQGKKGGQLTFITAETTFTNDAGERVAVTRTTYVHTEEAPDGE